MSKFGILGQTQSTEAASPVATFDQTQDIIADQAFVDATDLAHESSVLATSMEHGIAVAGQLERHVQLGVELMAAPELINKGSVVMACETMDLAFVALGGGSNDFRVSAEAAETAPVESFEVSHEGIKDVVKKVYESIKMVFKKIALTIKKLTAKLVVAMDGTGKKAEKMLKTFKETQSKLTPGKFEEGEGLKIVKSTAAFATVSSLLSNGGVLQTNVETVRDFVDASVADSVSLKEAVVKASSEAPETSQEDLVLNALKEGKFTSLRYQAAASIAVAGKVTNEAFKGLGGKAEAMKLTSDQVSELQLEDISGDAVFYPTYVKGNSIHGVVFFANKLEDDAAKDATAIISSLDYKNASVTAMSDSELEDAGKKLVVATAKDIEAGLSGLKTASKDLETYSKARMKDIDKAMKDIDDAAKKDSGIALLNRIAGTEFNKSRMFIAGQYVSSILAVASVARGTLTNLSKHIAKYK